MVHSDGNQDKYWIIHSICGNETLASLLIRCKWGFGDDGFGKSDPEALTSAPISAVESIPS